MKWFAAEMHCHTIHSDGSFTPAELAAHARQFGLDAFCMTDHNTMSATPEIRAEAAKNNLCVLPGTEWTTYFGHMLVQGCISCLDWEGTSPDTLEDFIPQIHSAGGAVGPAHPFRPGNPYGTGCHWEYHIRNWDHFDFYEVLSGENPTRHYYNLRALSHWTGLLDQGCRIAPTSGIDWHRSLKENTVYATTWLGSPDGSLTPGTMRQALLHGRTAVSTGPLPLFSLWDGTQEYFPGDSVSSEAAKQLDIRVSADMNRRLEQWGCWDIIPEQWRIVGPGGDTLCCLSFNAGKEQTAPLSAMPLWCRAELHGTIRGEHLLIGLTAPVYRSHPLTLDK